MTLKDLELLQLLRRRLHRLDPPRPIRDVRSAAAFVQERRIVMTTGRSSLPVLTEAIVGEVIFGSWMAHAEVHRIYRLLNRLAELDFIHVPLVMGKEVVMEPSLGPAVERIASDRGRIMQAAARLPALALRLLDDVYEKGKVRMDRWGVPNNLARPARTLLQKELLVTSAGFHTERGYHTAMVRPWSASDVSLRFAKDAKRLKLEEAEGILLVDALRSAVVAPEREVRRWFPFGLATLDALIGDGDVERLKGGAKSWLMVGR